MKKIWLTAAALLSLLAAPMQTQAQAPTGKENPKSSNEQFEQRVVELVNAERKKRRLRPLQVDADLQRAARYHSCDMAADDYFEHDSHDRKGSRLVSVCETFDRIEKFAPDFGGSAENISAGNPSPEDVVKGWMDSPGHRKNILNSKYTHIGVGYCNSGKKGWGHYWTQNFGVK